MEAPRAHHLQSPVTALPAAGAAVGCAWGPRLDFEPERRCDRFDRGSS